MLASPQSTPNPFGRSSPIGVANQPKRPVASRDRESNSMAEKTKLWIPMLQSASKGKDLIEKQLILLGGTPDLQREFLEQLNPESSSRQNPRSNDRRRQRQNIPISNRFALGYTYHDVLDVDQEDVLARLNIYMLANASGHFCPLLRPLLTGKTVKDTLITILLDWNDPFEWAKQLRQWIRFLRKVILGLDEETKISMEENINAWKEKRVGPDAQSSVQHEVVAAPGPGEWDEGLGVPISIVCVQSEKVGRLERELGWGDDQFDFLQQWLRTVLLKHGGSLIYTASFEPNNVRTLIHTSLNIQSLLKKEVAKHNVVDRDKILVPPSWDSWGKIRILREGFDPEDVSNCWSVEIQEPPEDTFDPSSSTKTSKPTTSEASGSLSAQSPPPTDSPTTSAVAQFEQSLVNPTPNASTYEPLPSNTEPTTTATPFQDFLATQSAVLEKLKAEDAANEAKLAQRIRQSAANHDGNEAPTPASGTMSPIKNAVASTFLTDSIGSHRVNVNGIDLDAEEATRRLRERENERNALKRGTANESTIPASAAGAAAGASGTASPSRPALTRGTGGEGSLTPSATSAAGDGKPSNEALHGFFANLIKKSEQGRARGGGDSSVASGTASPRRESPASVQRMLSEN